MYISMYHFCFVPFLLLPPAFVVAAWLARPVGIPAPSFGVDVPLAVGVSEVVL